MRKIRIGKDIAINWTITTNGEAIPLSGRDLKLLLTTPYNRKVELEFTTEENVVKTKYSGAEQKVLGTYNLTLWENYGYEGQSVVDACDVFMLVPRTCGEGFTDETVEEQSNLEIITSGGMLIPDAPTDGKTYGRSNGEWVEVGASDEFVTSEELNSTLEGYAKKSEIPDVSTLATKQEVTSAVSDKLTKTEAAQTYQPKGNYATTEQLAGKADATAIPTKVSQLQNDSNYLTAVPDEYITKTELQGKGYATTTEVSQAVADKLTKAQADEYYQATGDYALKSEIPDVSGFITSSQADGKYATLEQIGNIDAILDSINGEVI